jgi:hypothetical protein
VPRTPIRARHTPEQHQDFLRRAVPVAAPDQHNGYGDTDRSHSDVSSASQRNQIGIVLVEADEQEGQRKGPQQRSADSFNHMAEPPREESRIRDGLPRNGHGHVAPANNWPCTISAKNT